MAISFGKAVIVNNGGEKTTLLSVSSKSDGGGAWSATNTIEYECIPRWIGARGESGMANIGYVSIELIRA